MLHLSFGLLTGFAPLLVLFVRQVRPASATVIQGRQIQWPNLPNNLTDDVLQVAFAISPPCLNNTYCVQLTTTVIPRCERLRGDPGCWCGNHDPLHYCAICMSSPTNNQTTADQTQSATAGHAAFHVACNAYEELINGTATTTTSSSSIEPTSTSMTSALPTHATAGDSAQKTPIAPIIGGVVGGVVGLALILATVYLISLWLKKKEQGRIHGSGIPSNISRRSSEPMSYTHLAAPYPNPSLARNYSPGQVSPR